MTTLQCPECQRVFENEDEVVAKRALSTHRWTEHGIRSPRAIAEAERMARVAAGLTPPKKLKTLEDLGPKPPLDQVKARHAWVKAAWRINNRERDRATKRRYKELKARRAVVGPATPKTDEALVKSNLQKSAWWQVESPTAKAVQQSIKLSECPCCGARFVAIKPQ